MFFAQLKNELVKLFGKKRTYIGFGAFVIIQTVMLLLFKYGNGPRHQFERMLSGNGYLASEYISALTVGLFMLLPQVVLLLHLYVALVGGDLVAKEAEDGTLRMILSRPISRVRLLLVKWFAGMIFAAALVIMLGTIAPGFARILFPWKSMVVIAQGASMLSVFPPGQGLALYIFSQLFVIVNAITLLSVAFMFSCFNMKPAAATILALSFLFISLVMQHIPFFEQYQNWFVTHHFECWLLIFQTPTPWTHILQSATILLAFSATAFIIGATAFQMRDIKS